MKRAGRILLIDDDDSLASAVCEVLETRGYEVTHKDDGICGLNEALENTYDVVLTDLRMPGSGGMEVLDRLSEERPRLPVILMTAYSSTGRAIEATKHGAFDYLAKPFEMEELLVVLNRAIETSRLAAKSVTLGGSATEQDTLVGSSRAMQEVFKAIGRVAEKQIPVMILGETGTGKEMVARAIFQHSERAGKPYIAVNCAAIPDNLIESELFGHERGAFTGAISRRIGRFEQANRGTLFLDEIGDLPAQTQVKLLRVLQERKISRVGGTEEIPIDVRIVSATHRDLDKMIAEGSFREDLLYRLNAMVIRLPALRERIGDIEELTKFLMIKHASLAGDPVPALENRAISILEEQSWPGNVRQLENVVRRVMLAEGGGALTVAGVKKALLDPPANSAKEVSDPGAATLAELVASRLQNGDGAWDTLLADLEKECYAQAVAVCSGNQSKMARLLGVSRVTVRDKLDKFGLFPTR